MTTISNNYFEEYTEFLDEIQNRIMKIQLKFNECQSLISSDYSKGFIAKEVAEKMLAVRINQFVPSMDRMYRLSKEEIDFINQYAALDSQGNVLATILKPEYIEKANMLDKILRSVQTYHFYENLDSTSKRVKIKAELTTAFSRRIASLKGKLESIKRVRGENAEKSETYQQIQAEITKCSDAIDSFEQVMGYDDETVRKVISSFYHVDYSYYEWYTKMDLISLKETDELYTEHTDTMQRTSTFCDDFLEKQNQVKSLSDKLIISNNSLLSFIESIIELDLDEFEEENLKGYSFFKKAKLQGNNMELLIKLFTQLTTIPGVTTYLQETFYQDTQLIEVSDCFQKYISANYPETTTYIDLNSFLLTFKRAVISHYKSTIKKLQKELESQIKITGGLNVAIVNGVEKGYSQALLQQRVYNAATIDPKSLVLDGFTTEELTRIYTSLKDILGTQYHLDTKNEELVTNKKGL